MRKHNLHFIICAAFALLAMALPAYAAIPAMQVTVIDANNKVAFSGITNSNGTFSSADLGPGQYVVRFRTKNQAVKADQYMLIVDAGGKPLLSNAIEGVKFTAGGVAVRMEVKNPSKIKGQVESTSALAHDNVKVVNGRRYFLVKSQFGSNLGTRWVDEKAVQRPEISSLDVDSVRLLQELGTQGNNIDNARGPGPAADPSSRGTRPDYLRAGSVGREDQSKVRIAGAIRCGAVGVVERESTFLQDADRGDVVLRCAGVKRARLFQAKKSGERAGSDAAAPIRAVDPVADLALPVRTPAHDMPATSSFGSGAQRTWRRSSGSGRCGPRGSSPSAGRTRRGRAIESRPSPPQRGRADVRRTAGDHAGSTGRKAR